MLEYNFYVQYEVWPVTSTLKIGYIGQCIEGLVMLHLPLTKSINIWPYRTIHKGRCHIIYPTILYIISI